MEQLRHSVCNMQMTQVEHVCSTPRRCSESDARLRDKRPCPNNEIEDPLVFESASFDGFDIPNKTPSEIDGQEDKSSKKADGPNLVEKYDFF